MIVHFSLCHDLHRSLIKRFMEQKIPDQCNCVKFHDVWMKFATDWWILWFFFFTATNWRISWFFPHAQLTNFTCFSPRPIDKLHDYFLRPINIVSMPYSSRFQFLFPENFNNRIFHQKFLFHWSYCVIINKESEKRTYSGILWWNS